METERSTAINNIKKGKEQFDKTKDYFQRKQAFELYRSGLTFMISLYKNIDKKSKIYTTLKKPIQQWLQDAKKMKELLNE